MPLLSRSRKAAQGNAPSYALELARVIAGRNQTNAPTYREPVPASPRPGFFETCANPGCSLGRLRLWRSRRTAVFEGGWCCSSGCRRAQLESALSREMNLRGAEPETHRHRIPLGLVMLEQGWITAAQLRAALDAQRSAGAGLLGQWLVRQRATSEELVTRALGVQWSCPVLSAEYHDADAMTALLPRLFVDAFRALPLRVAAGKILYLGFEDHPDPVLALAIGRMTGLRVESGFVPGSVFRAAHAKMLAAQYPRAGLIEAASEIGLRSALSKAMEQARPAEARLVRVHDCLWLRMWFQPQMRRSPGHNAIEGSAADSIEDLICSRGGG